VEVVQDFPLRRGVRRQENPQRRGCPIGFRTHSPGLSSKGLTAGFLAAGPVFTR
jgi:hypothetical protein